MEYKILDTMYVTLPFLFSILKATLLIITYAVNNTGTDQTLSNAQGDLVICSLKIAGNRSARVHIYLTRYAPRLEKPDLVAPIPTLLFAY